MNAFDLLMAGNLVVLVMALYQLRPAALLFAGNNLLVARALAGFERYGAPRSMHFLPVWVYSQENLNTAATIMGISLACLVVTTAIPRRGGPPMPADAPAVPRAVLWMVAIYLLVYMGAKATILTGGYAGEATVRYRLDLAGEHILILSLALYELARRRLLGLITARKAMAIVAVIGAIQYLQGATGITTGYLFVGTVLVLPRAGSSKRVANMARIGAAMLAVLLLSLVVRGTRAVLHEGGVHAVREFVQNEFSKEESREQSAEGVENTANASQSATHMLVCISLYDSGISRDWRSITDVVEYTFKPSIFERLFGWKRSVLAPVELGKHFIHGGGINVLGEFYWNGGYLCVIVMTIAIVLFCFLVDTRYRASAFWLMLASQFAPAFLMGYGYGFAQVARGAINGLLIVLAYRVLGAALGSETSRAAPMESAKA